MQYQRSGDSKPTVTNQSMNSSQLLSQKPYSEVKSSNQGKKRQKKKEEEEVIIKVSLLSLVLNVTGVYS